MPVSTTYATLRKRDTLGNAFNFNSPDQQPAFNPASLLTRPQQTTQPNMQAINDYTRSPLKANIDDWRKADDARMAQQTQAMSDAQATPPGGQIVHGNNIQSDIPHDNPANYVGVDAQGNPNPAPMPALNNTLPTQAATVAPLPTTSPKPVTPEIKSATPEQKQAASKAVSTVMQAAPPTSAVGAATQAQDHDKIQNDLQAIADSKHPHKAWQNLQEQPFYKNSSFYSGLIGVGLSIMSGKSPVEAFQTGMAMNQQDDMKKQLQFNRDALIDQGYSADSVANAIAKGDPSVLKMKQMSEEDKANQQAALWQYQHDLERQEGLSDYNMKRADAQADNAQKFEQDKQLAQIRADNTLNVYKSKEEYKANIKQQEAQAGNWQPDRSQMASERTAWTQTQSKFGNRALNFGTAEHAINQGRYSDDVDKANANAQIALEQTAQALIGGQRSIDQKDLDELAGSPNVIQRVGNKFKVAAGFKPTDRFWNYLDNLVQADKSATMGPLKERMVQRAASLAANGGYTPAQASILVNRAANLGFTISTEDVQDYLDQGGSPSPSRQGAALSPQGNFTSGDQSWMTGAQH